MFRTRPRQELSMTSQSDIVAQILTQAEANWQLALGWLQIQIENY